MKKYPIIKLAVMAIAAAILIACMEKKEYVIEHNVYVNYSSLNLFPGDQFQLQASPGNATIEWSSEDPNVAQTSASGLIEAKGAGTTNIIAANGATKQKVQVTVTVPKADKVTTRPGHNRVQVEIDIKNDRIKTAKIVRSGSSTPVTININYKAGIFNAFYPDLPEGRQTFSVFFYDKYDNESTPMETAGLVYGNEYLSGLKNRVIKAATLFGNGLCIGWNDNDSYRCDIDYVGSNNTARSIISPKGEKTTYIFDFVSGLTYNTLFLPEPASIDTFRLETVTYSEIGNKVPVFSAETPCEIQARDFDIGGEGVGYHDSDNNNSGGNYAYREDLGDFNSRGVDIEGGGNTGYNDEGEWLMYTVHVKNAGNYAADMYLSVNNGSGGKYSLEVDGVKTEIISMENNNSWGDWRWYHERNPSTPPPLLNLTAGIHKIKFIFESSGYNFMALKFTYME